MKNNTIEIDTPWAKIKRLPKKYFFLVLAVIVLAIIAAVLIFVDITCQTDHGKFETKTKLKSK